MKQGFRALLSRRRFFRWLGGVAATLQGAPAAAAAVRRVASLPSVDSRNWTWVHGGREGTAADWRQRFLRLRDVGLHGVLVSGGDLDLLADAAHAADLEFHRWIWVLNRNGDAWVKENHPEWFTVSRNGESTLEKPPYVGYYKWVCPSRQPVREYLQQVVEPIASHPGVDGVHLDYIRYPDVILPVGLWKRYGLVQDREHPEFDFCYCDVCRATFERQAGVDPMSLADAPANVEWREFRWNSVTALVTDLSETVRAHGKRISAAVFPTPTLARRLVRQAWDQWPLDAVFPMLYHQFYEEELPWIGEATRDGVDALPPSVPLYSGLYLPSLSAEETAAAVRVARGGGASGVSFFEMGRLTDPYLEQLEGVLKEEGEQR